MRIRLRLNCQVVTLSLMTSGVFAITPYVSFADPNLDSKSKTTETTSGEKTAVSAENSTTQLQAKATYLSHFTGFDFSKLAPIPMKHKGILFGGPREAAVTKLDFRNWMNNTYPGFKLFASHLDSSTILNVKGQWDNASTFLFNLGFPHSNVDATDLDAALLKHAKVLIIDCPGTIPKDKYSLVAQFVRNGGTLLTSDCDLCPLLQTVFPGFIEWNMGTNKSLIVDARLSESEPDLSSGAREKGFWKLDKACQLIRIKNARAVSILAYSEKLAQEDPDKQGILAVTFDVGKGKILHTIGHFDNNTVDAQANLLADSTHTSIISLRQILAANFVLRGLKLAAENGEL